MVGQIKTKKTWQRHLPGRPSRVQRGYYSEQKNVSRKKVVKIIWIILVILLIQSIFQAPYLKIDNIELSGNNDLSYDEVSEALEPALSGNKFLFFKNNNYFLLNTEPLAGQLIEKFNLDQATVQKKFPDKLLVTVKEKISYFIWSKDDSLYLLDAKGILNRQINALDEKYLILEDKRDYRPLDDKIFTDQEVDIVNQLYLGWNDIIDANIKLNKIVIYNDWSIELYTKLGFYVKVDKDEDIAGQLDNLNKVLTENIAGVDIDYIDIRFGDKVYFK
ncbi:FtsQ-type POTRA domain-containing protein [Patescibacteria group bacterium]|nr:FtsQ-type POTRA domain-containing protein [Patescibacteria group bacterium]